MLNNNPLTIKHTSIIFSSEEARGDKEEVISNNTRLEIGTCDKTKFGVYTVIYKLHLVAPSILTTVIGNVTTHLINLVCGKVKI